MCGIAGIFSINRGHLGMTEALARRMADTLIHRGPDDTGVWLDRNAGIALAHRRLSILDLSSSGHQPMVSETGRWSIAFNGEIYNHLVLREELKTAGAATWRGHSDTETLLACIETWGLEKTLRQIVGMFALALWDSKNRFLWLARDRMGEKPLYYGWQNGVFLFGSELKALRVHPAFQGRIDRNSLTLLLRHSYIPTPYSIYQGIRKLPPGTFLRLSLDSDNGSSGKCSEPQKYWSLSEAATCGQRNLFSGSNVEAIKKLENILKESVRQQMIADVPLGAFLSGGIDSSTVVAMMQAQSSQPVRTFAIGFHESAYNEAEYAKAVARHLGTNHTELYVKPQQAMDIIPRLSVLYDEPFSDPSQIPTFLISEMTRRHVTVSLSGDAGDELFGGYNRYFLARQIWQKTGRLPIKVRKMIARGITILSTDQWDRLAGVADHFLPSTLRDSLLGDKAYKLAETILAMGNQEELYHWLNSQWKEPASVVIDATEPQTVLSDQCVKANLVTFEERMMYLDALSYLPDDILVKVDRAAMGVSLETRMPFLDHRVVEFAWRLPLSMKIRDGEGKWILRQVLYKYIPKELIEREKKGFAVPIDSWLRGPMRDWGESLLDEYRLKREGFFHPKPILQKWHEHLSGKRNWSRYLWNVLMFQAWLENNNQNIS